MLTRVYDKDDILTITFKSQIPLPLEFLKFSISTVYPNIDLQNVTFSIEENSTRIAYPSMPTQVPMKVICSLARNEFGQRRYLDPRMSQARAGSGQQSPQAPGSPVIGSPKVGNLLQQSTRIIHDKGLQDALRSACLRRDQACVITGQCAENKLDCCHVLSVEYGAQFLETPAMDQHLADLPIVAFRYRREMDIRNAIILAKETHASFDAFDFTIVPFNAELVVWSFKECGLHGAKVRRPSRLPNGDDPDYFIKLFPSDEVFLEHARQGILRNLQAAGETDDEYDDDDEAEATMERATSSSTLVVPDDCNREEKMHRLDALDTELQEDTLLI